MCAGNDTGSSLLRALGRLVPMQRPGDARSRGRCALPARLHLAVGSPGATKFRVLLAPLRRRVRRTIPPTACPPYIPGRRVLSRSAMTILAAEAGAVCEIRGHFFLRPHRRRCARNIPVQTGTRGNGRRRRARGLLRNSVRHFPAAASPASSARCESRRSLSPLLPNLVLANLVLPNFGLANLVLPNLVLLNLALMNPRLPNPRSRNSD